MEILREENEAELNPRGFNPDIDAKLAGTVGDGDTRRFIATAGGQSFEFSSESDARDMIRNFNRTDDPGIRRRVYQDNRSARLNIAQRVGVAWNGIDDVPGEKRRFVRAGLERLNNIPGWKFLGRTLETVGFGYALYEAQQFNILYYQDKAESGEITQEELETYIIASQASFGAQLTVLILTNLKSGTRAVRLMITGVRAAVRTVQLGAAASGVGFIPSVISAIVTESGFILAQYLLTRPSVQRAFTEWLVEYANAGVLEAVAGVTNMALRTAGAALNAVTDGVLGTGSMLRGLGFEPRETEMPTGTAYASSEWAKIVFQNSLFPEGMTSQLVEYIPPGERRDLIIQKMDLSAEPQQPANNDNSPVTGLDTTDDARAARTRAAG